MSSKIKILGLFIKSSNYSGRHTSFYSQTFSENKTTQTLSNSFYEAIFLDTKKVDSEITKKLQKIFLMNIDIKVLNKIIIDYKQVLYKMKDYTHCSSGVYPGMQILFSICK